MKAIVSLMMMILLVGCNGGAGSSSESFSCDLDAQGNPICSGPTEVNEINYKSLGAFSTYNYYGTILEKSVGGDMNKDEITLPSQLTVAQDEDSSLRIGDTAYVVLNNYWDNRCEYVYDGTEFVFNECKDDLAGYMDTDELVLDYFIHPTFGTNDLVQIVLFGRLAADLHTGNIDINASL